MRRPTQLINSARSTGHAERLGADAAGADGAVDQPIEIRFHQPDVAADRHIAGEGQALIGFVDRQDRPHHRRADVARAQRQRKEQT